MPEIDCNLRVSIARIAGSWPQACLSWCGVP